MTAADENMPEEALRLMGPWGRLARRIGPRNTRLLRIAIGAAAGAVMGLGYYLLIGCTTGTCPITSNPYIAMVYGAVVGGLVTTR